MKVIVTRRARKWVRNIAKNGTKRQRAKYRNAYCTLTVRGSRITGYMIGKHWDDGIVGELKLAREQRRIGLPAPEFVDDKIHEPMWDGVKGMRGAFWTYRGDLGDVWVGRE